MKSWKEKTLDFFFQKFNFIEIELILYAKYIFAKSDCLRANSFEYWKHVPSRVFVQWGLKEIWCEVWKFRELPSNRDAPIPDIGIGWIGAKKGVLVSVEELGYWYREYQ